VQGLLSMMLRVGCRRRLCCCWRWYLCDSAPLLSEIVNLGAFAGAVSLLGRCQAVRLAACLMILAMYIYARGVGAIHHAHTIGLPALTLSLM
jgi:hypothetical protein